MTDLREFLDGDDGVWYDRFGLWTQGKRDTAWLVQKLDAAGVTLAATPAPLDVLVAAKHAAAVLDSCGDIYFHSGCKEAGAALRAALEEPQP